MNISLNKPLTPNMEKVIEYLEQVHSNNWYTNFGPLHQQLTERLEKYLGVDNLLLVSNGTLALQVASKVLGVKNIITTPFSFVATTSSLLWQGMDVSFCDIDRQTYNLNADLTSHVIKNNSHFDGVLATHVFGNPCDVDAYESLASENNVKVIYDAAHAFGVKIGKRSILSYGDASTLSFHATKVFHTVEGGAIVFKNRDDYEKAKRLINFGLDSDGNFSEVGINAKLNEYQCAVGLSLLDNISEIINHRAELFEAYRKGLQGVVEMPVWHSNANYNGAYFPIYLGLESNVNNVMKALSERNIQSRRYFSPSLDTVFKEQDNHGSENSNAISLGILCLPLHYYMTLSNVDEVIKIIKKVML